MAKKICLVTGANGAIGKAMVEEFKNENMIVIATDLYLKGLQKGESVFEYILDVTNDSLIDKFFDEINKKFTKIDVLVNCAGILRSKSFDELQVNEWNQTLSINLTGTFAVSQKVYQLMKKNKGGVIVNIASDAGEIGSTMSSADYAVSKAGVICLTKCIAREGAEFGIRSNVIAPGFIKSEMLEKFEEYWGMEKLKETVDSIPLRRMGCPEEVAKLASFLASENAQYITGATFDINGGSCMN